MAHLNPQRGVHQISRLALARAACDWAPMSDRKETRLAGGSLLALSIILGSVGGAVLGQSSLGFLVGAGVGVLLLLLVWFLSRRV